MIDDKKIKEALVPGKLDLPAKPRVQRIKFRHHTDSSSSEDIDTLWITVVLDEQTSDRDRRWSVLDPIDEAIRRALRNIGFDAFPYIDYLKPSEIR